MWRTDTPTPTLQLAPTILSLPSLAGAITKVRTPGGGEASAIRSPHVLRAARAQFGCPSLEGAQLCDAQWNALCNALCIALCNAL